MGINSPHESTITVKPDSYEKQRMFKSLVLTANPNTCTGNKNLKRQR